MRCLTQTARSAMTLPLRFVIFHWYPLLLVGRGDAACSWIGGKLFTK
jgi:hypothetical protein